MKEFNMSYKCNLCGKKTYKKYRGFVEEMRIRFSPSHYTVVTGICRKCNRHWKLYTDGKITAKQFMDRNNFYLHFTELL